MRLHDLVSGLIIVSSAALFSTTVAAQSTEDAGRNCASARPLRLPEGAGDAGLPDRPQLVFWRSLPPSHGLGTVLANADARNETTFGRLVGPTVAYPETGGRICGVRPRTLGVRESRVGLAEVRGLRSDADCVVRILSNRRGNVGLMRRPLPLTGVFPYPMKINHL